MGIIAFMLLAAFIGVIAWALITYIPMPQPIKTVIVIAAVVVVVAVLLQALGLIGHDVPIPRLR